MALLPTEKFISPKTDSKEDHHKLEEMFLKILINSQEKKSIWNTTFSKFLPSFFSDKIILVPVKQPLYEFLNC